MGGSKQLWGVTTVAYTDAGEVKQRQFCLRFFSLEPTEKMGTDIVGSLNNTVSSGEKFFFVVKWEALNIFWG